MIPSAFGDYNLGHIYLTLGGRALEPVLTARYSHQRLYDLARAVEKVPRFLLNQQANAESQALRATGTHGRELSPAEVLLTARLSGPGHIRGQSSAPDGIEREQAARGEERHRSLNDRPLGTRKHPEASSYLRVGEGTRTPDIPIHRMAAGCHKLLTG
jgi:hypothetical protein